MNRKTLSAFVAAMMLASCGGGSWIPWRGSSGDSGASGVPPGAEAFTCAGGKKLLLRFERDTQSAWVIHSRGEYRLDRDAAAERYSKGRTILTLRDGEAELTEGGKVEFARCKPESAK